MQTDFETEAQRGPLWDRYCTYRDNTSAEHPLSFDEWLEA